ncbi:sodium:dicarboxylate symporter family domain-containing protein [Phthorimaea operculella]|nr:sodium:dicarboxylate symporter family domain-containing protein [Phthorimaea operculella]
MMDQTDFNSKEIARQSACSVARRHLHPLHDTRPRYVLITRHVHLSRHISHSHTDLERPKMPLQLRQGACASFLRGNLLTMLTVIGVVSGTMVGWGLRATGYEWSRREVMYFQYPGELFLRMLKCLIVPLLVSSIVSAIASLDLSLSGKVGMRAILYYMTTTFCAVILGIVLVTTIKPGRSGDAEFKQMAGAKAIHKETLTSDTLLDLSKRVILGIVLVTTIKPGRSGDAELKQMAGAKAIHKETLTSDTLLDLVRVILDIVLVTTIKPGRSGNAEFKQMAGAKAIHKETLTSDTLLDLSKEVIPGIAGDHHQARKVRRRGIQADGGRQGNPQRDAHL